MSDCCDQFIIKLCDWESFKSGFQVHFPPSVFQPCDKPPPFRHGVKGGYWHGLDVFHSQTARTQ